MDPLQIPVTAIGPGSQPEGDEPLEFMEMPRGMYQHRTPAVPEPEVVENLPAARRLFCDLHHALSIYRCGQPAIRLSLASFSAGERRIVDEVMGEGEVSVSVEPGSGAFQIQETVFTGVWRVRELSPAGEVVDDFLEVGDIPSAVRRHSFTGNRELDCGLEGLPPGVQNAPALLVEIADRLREWQPGTEAHVINLTLLPLSAEDLILLGERLGVGPVTLLSRGYGNCRMGSTALDNVWWVKYYNSQDALILNSIEIVDVPPVALAAPEDIEDSCKRLWEIVELYT